MDSPALSASPPPVVRFRPPHSSSPTTRQVPPTASLSPPQLVAQLIQLFANTSPLAPLAPAAMSANTHQHTTSAKVLTAIHNIPRRVRSGTLRAPRAAGKENDPGAPSSFAQTTTSARPATKRHRPAPLLPQSLHGAHAHALAPSAPIPIARRTPTTATTERTDPVGSFLSMSPDAWDSPLPAAAPDPPRSARARKFAALPPIPEPRAEPARWAPAADGRIVLKVWVPTTDEVWKVRVPAGTGLAAFRARVEAKLGFAVCFSAVRAGILRSVVDEGAFREWVRERVVDGRNTLLTAHRLELQ